MNLRNNRYRNLSSVAKSSAEPIMLSKQEMKNNIQEQIKKLS